ncbi:Lactation elevated protein 1 [Hordeum vulgare]|nr:Lactation elevated protein 1 [Hordeum vulgare]
MNTVSGMKRKKVPTKKPSATPSAPARRSPTVPSYGADSTAGEVFDETSGRESPSKRGSLTEMDEDEDGDGLRNLNKPDGDKKTKEKIKREHEASTLRNKTDPMLQSNEVLLAKSLDAKIELAEKKAREKQERWKLLEEVEERKARATENKTMAGLLVEENRIMTLNRNDMDDISKEWHDMTMREILNRRMPVCCNGGDGFSSGIETDDFGAGAGTSADDGFGGVDGFGGSDELDGEDCRTRMHEVLLRLSFKLCSHFACELCFIV